MTHDTDPTRFATDEARPFARRVLATLEAHRVAAGYDSGDLYGTLMSVAFDTCDELYRREAPIPDELGYRPGVFGPPSRDEVSNPEVLDLSTEALTDLASELDGLIDEARGLGLDY